MEERNIMGNGINDETTTFKQFKQSTPSFKLQLASLVSVIAIFSVVVTLAVTYGGDKTNLENLNKVMAEMKTDFNGVIVDLKAEIVENRHKDEERGAKLNEIGADVKLLLYQVKELNKNR